MITFSVDAWWVNNNILFSLNSSEGTYIIISFLNDSDITFLRCVSDYNITRPYFMH